MSVDWTQDPRLDPELARLIYELLDAHTDTAELAAPLVEQEAWLAHLDYLRDLQRVARHTLAQRALEPEFERALAGVCAPRLGKSGRSPSPRRHAGGSG
jgi:hypothetical protein